MTTIFKGFTGSLENRDPSSLTGGAFYYQYDSGWNDYGYHCQYHIYYIFPDGFKHVGYDKIFSVGTVKIGYKDQPFGDKLDVIENIVEKKSNDYFSLGTSKTYYENIIRLYNMDLVKFEEYFKSLHDIAFDLKYATTVYPEYDSPEKMKSKGASFSSEAYSWENPINNSLLRDRSTPDDYIEYSNIANRRSLFDDYFIRINNDYLTEEIVLRPSKGISDQILGISDQILNKNIYSIIGKNGVGKSTLLKKIYADFNDANIIYTNRDGVIENSNAYFISLSPFEQKLQSSAKKNYFGLQMDQEKIKTDIYKLFSDDLKSKYSEDGLLKVDSSTISRDIFFNSFANSVTNICMNNRFDRWVILIKKVVPAWESYKDVFDEAQRLFNSARSYESINEFIKNSRCDKSNIKRKFSHFYDNLFDLMYQQSSGISFAILVLTYIFYNITDNSLILFDEPENHLHPPLLSSIIDAVSWICNDTNSVALLATHSPVVIQQLVKENVFILDNNLDEVLDNEIEKGYKLSHRNPEIPTFGENIGKINRLIFSYEIDKSGYYNKIEKYYGEFNKKSEIVSELMKNSGFEARTLISEREKFFSAGESRRIFD
ncbi:AAA family ATPase [Rothia nasimurium]|uniref:AAA family ATPase n=1 Tax=Rothia nasimurium TaxID=85336 RepID=UPI001F007D05|nr:AAA family ATPase [Rothia nasimurium]